VYSCSLRYLPGGFLYSVLITLQNLPRHVSIEGLVTTAAGFVSQERSTSPSFIVHEKHCSPVINRSNQIYLFICLLVSWTENFVVSLRSNQQMRRGSCLIYCCIQILPHHVSAIRCHYQGGESYLPQKLPNQYLCCGWTVCIFLVCVSDCYVADLLIRILYCNVTRVPYWSVPIPLPTRMDGKAVGRPNSWWRDIIASPRFSHPELYLVFASLDSWPHWIIRNPCTSTMQVMFE
jgi:hypothetical protein